MTLTLVAFAGCNLSEEGGNGGPAPDPENPQAMFDELYPQHLEAWADTITEQFPEFESYDVSETELTVDGTANLIDISSTGMFTLAINGRTDRSEPENPVAQAEMEFNGEMEGEQEGTVRARVEMRMVNQMIYASLRTLDVEIPQVPVSQFMVNIEPLIGNWFGDNLARMREFPGAEGNIDNILEGQWLNAQELKTGMRDIIADATIFEMEEGLPSDGDFYVFRVSVNKDELIRTAVAFSELAQASESQVDQYEADLREDLERVEIGGILSIHGDEPKYFKFDGELVNSEATDQNAKIMATVLENEKSIEIMPENADHTKMTVTSTGNTHQFSLMVGENEDENITIVDGEKSDSEITMNMYAGIEEGEEPQAVLQLEKSGAQWTGTITSSQNPDVVIFIESLSFNESSFDMSALVKDGEEELVTLNVSYDMQEASNVEVEAPEEYEPFGELMTTFMGGMMMGVPGGGGMQFEDEMPMEGDPFGASTDGMSPPVPMELDIDELNEMMEGMEMEGGEINPAQLEEMINGLQQEIDAAAAAEAEIDAELQE